MSAISNSLPFPLGTYLDSTPGGFLAGVLGQIYKSGPQNMYRLVQAGASTILTNSVLCTARTSGRPTWVVSVSSVGADPTVVGVVPEEYTATIPASAYFLMQVQGNPLVLAGDTTVVNTSGLEVRLVNGSAASGVARTLAAFTTASTTEEYGVFAIASNTAVATAVGQTIRCMLSLRPTA
jgi:hypothetical protein